MTTFFNCSASKSKKGDYIMQEALGIVETIGLATGIQAADAAVKAANVTITSYNKVGGGRVNVFIRGDVAAVKAAVDAATASASQIGKVVGTTVIPASVGQAVAGISDRYEEITGRIDKNSVSTERTSACSDIDFAWALRGEVHHYRIVDYYESTYDRPADTGHR
jgi:ethanolamine utilization protein EutM